MAIVVTHLETDGRDPDATSYVTGSVTIPANNLGLIWITTAKGTTPDTPSITNWTLVTDILWSTTGTPTRRTSLLRRMPGSDETGTLTISYGGTQTACLYSIAKCAGVDTSGTNGSGATVAFQEGMNDTAETAALFNFDVTPNAANTVLAGFSWNNQGTLTQGSGFTMLAQDTTATSTINIGTEYRLDGTNVAMSNASSARWAGLAIEVLPAAAVAARPKRIKRYASLPVTERARW